MNLDKIIVPYNYVLVKEIRKSDELHLKSGLKLFVDDTYEKEKHAPTYGLVVKSPEKLYFDMEDEELDSVAYDVDIELKTGDICFFHYLCTLNCRKEINKLFFEDGDDTYYMIKYDSMFAGIRGEEIFGVNGYLLVEGVENEDRKMISKTGLVASDATLEESEKRGIVKYTSGMVRNYFYDTTGKFDTDEVKSGDEVTFNRLNSIPLEYGLHRILGEGKPYFRMMRSDIISIKN